MSLLYSSLQNDTNSLLETPIEKIENLERETSLLMKHIKYINTDNYVTYTKIIENGFKLYELYKSNDKITPFYDVYENKLLEFIEYDGKSGKSRFNPIELDNIKKLSKQYRLKLNKYY